jgi:lipopolysaccharide transport system ATP-binding protein
VKQLSDRAILLVGGRMAAEGAPKDVINRYIGLVLEKERSGAPRSVEIGGSFRHGDGASEILEVRLLNREGAAVQAVAAGEPVVARVRCRFRRPMPDPMVGILIRTRIGTDVYGTNTRLEKAALGNFAPGDTLEVDFRFDCWLAPQEYTLTVAAQHADGSSNDWVDDALSFTVVDAKALAGVANLRATVEFRR